MYRIVCDGTTIADSRRSAYGVMDGKISEGINNIGGCEFTLLANNPMRNLVVPRSSMIEVYENDSLLWDGRAMNVTDKRGYLTVECDGPLSFFYDTVIAPFSFNGTFKGLVQKIVTEHNNQLLHAGRLFTLGSVGLPDYTGQISYVLKDYSSTWDVIADVLKTYGGEITSSKTDSGHEITWRKDSGYKNSQEIWSGKNLISVSVERSGEDFYTGILPIGKDGITVETVNNNSKILRDIDATAVYGDFVKPIEFDAETPDALLVAAKAQLAGSAKVAEKIEATAFDLHCTNKEIEPFSVGDHVRIVSPAQKLDNIVRVTERTVCFPNVSKSTITLGGERVSISSQKTAATYAKRIRAVQATANNASTVAHAAQVNANEVKANTGGMKFITGTGTIPYGETSGSVAVNFGFTFSEPPVVVTSQVFETNNVIVKDNDITTTGFTARVSSGFSSSGSRSFRWIAIGL